MDMIKMVFLKIKIYKNKNHQIIWLLDKILSNQDKLLRNILKGTIQKFRKNKENKE